MPSLRPTLAQRRAAWSLADQVLSSGTNFLMLFLVVRTASITEVGAFGLAYTTFFFILAAVRGIAVEPLVVRYVNSSPDVWRAGAASASGLSLLLGSLIGSLLVLAGVALDGPVWEALAAMGAILPGLLVQDAWRLAFFCAARPQHAFWNDFAFLVIQTTGYLALFLANMATLVALILVWGAAASAAALMGNCQAQARPRPSAARQWFTNHRDIGPAFAGDALANRGSEQAAMAIISVAAGLAPLGALTAARSLFAPLTTVQSGINSFALPDAARLHHAGEIREIKRRSWQLGTLMAMAMIILGGLLSLVPSRWGVAILGQNWSSAVSLLPSMTAFSAVNAFSYGIWIGLKAVQAAKAVMYTRLAWGLIMVIGAGIGAYYGGASGATWAMAIAVSGQALFLARLLASRVRLHSH